MDQKRFASASDDNSIKIWDISTGDCLDSCDPREVYVEALGNIGGTKIVFGSDPVLGVYDCDTKKLLVNNVMTIFTSLQALKVLDGKIFVGGIGANDPDKIAIIEINDLLPANQH